MNNKRGSISVFLVFIIASVIGVTAAFIYAAKQNAQTGISDGVINLAMRSILSEYDLNLYQRYGLIAFEKTGMETALEINDYVDYSFEGKSPVKKTQVDFGNHSLADINTLKKQIIDYMQLTGLKHIAEDKQDDIEIKDWEDRTLRNSGVINNLPSKPFDDEGAGFIERIEEIKNQITSVDNILSSASETYLIDTYVMNHFKYGTSNRIDEPSFFRHEVEYILVGSCSNLKNREKVESALKIIRTAMNTVYLYKDEKRYSQTLAAAELLTPASAPATQAVIIGTWAAAEAGNDVKLLLKGKPVPLIKTDESWATSLDNVLNNITEGVIDTGIDEGLYYSDYLMVLLHFQHENTKLARIADLVQINMKSVKNRDFLLKTCNDGFYLTTQIFGKEHSYETCY